LYNIKVKKIFITIELFLIILVLVLLAFLFFVFVYQKKEPTPENQSVSVDTSELYCGITVTNPSVNSFVSLPLKISGYISGCGWETYMTYVAKMTVFDEEGLTVGRPFLIHKNENSLSPVSSQFSLELKDLPVKDNEKITLVFESINSGEEKFSLPVVLQPKIETEDEIQDKL